MSRTEAQRNRLAFPIYINWTQTITSPCKLRSLLSHKLSQHWEKIERPTKVPETERSFCLIYDSEEYKSMPFCALLGALLISLTRLESLKAGRLSLRTAYLWGRNHIQPVFQYILSHFLSASWDLRTINYLKHDYISFFPTIRSRLLVTSSYFI